MRELTGKVLTTAAATTFLLACLAGCAQQGSQDEPAASLGPGTWSCSEQANGSTSRWSLESRDDGTFISTVTSTWDGGGDESSSEGSSKRSGEDPDLFTLTFDDGSEATCRVTGGTLVMSCDGLTMATMQREG